MDIINNKFKYIKFNFYILYYNFSRFSEFYQIIICTRNVGFNIGMYFITVSADNLHMVNTSLIAKKINNPE